MDIKQLREEFATLHTQAGQVLTAASTDKRELTAEEKQANAARFARMDTIQAMVNDAKAEQARSFEELKKLQDEMNDPQNGKWNLKGRDEKQALLDQMSGAFSKGITARRDEANKQYDLSKSNTLLDAQQRVVGMKADIQEQSLRATGHFAEAEALKVREGFEKQRVDLERWAEETSRTYPDAAKQVRQYAQQIGSLID